MRQPYSSESLISSDHVDVDRIDTRGATTFFVVDTRTYAGYFAPELSAWLVGWAPADFDGREVAAWAQAQDGAAIAWTLDAFQPTACLDGEIAAWRSRTPGYIYLLDQPKGRDGLWPIAPIAEVAAGTPIRHPENSLALAFRRPLDAAEIAQLCDRARFFVRHFVRPAEIRLDIDQRIVELNVDDIFRTPAEPIALLGFRIITVAVDGTRSVETSPA